MYNVHPTSAPPGSSRRYWVEGPGSKAGPAFIAAGVLSAMSESIAILSNPNVVGPDNTSYLIGDLVFLIATIMLILAELALLVGLAAIYTRWSKVLDWLGKGGLLLAAVGFAALSAANTLSMLDALLHIVFTGSPGFSGPGIEFSIMLTLPTVTQIAGYTAFAGMALLGIFSVRANPNLLPGWAKGMLLIIGLWGLLARILDRSVIPALIPIAQAPQSGFISSPWRTELTYMLYLLGSILWVSLGLAFLGFSRKSLGKDKTLPLLNDKTGKPS